MSIKVNDTVKIVSGPYEIDFHGQIGKVKCVYDGFDIAIVQFDNGIAKVYLSDLVRVDHKAAEDKDISEGAKLISETEWREAVKLSTMSNVSRSSDPTVGMTGLVVGMNIGKRIFAEQSSVDLTKKDFIAILWDECSPLNVSKSIGEKMDAEKCVSVSLAAVLSLRETIEILFGESDHA